MDMKLRVGTRLAQERGTRNMSQADMAELLSVSASTYSRLERNETSVEIEQLLNFAKTLNIPPQEFLPETITIHNHDNEQDNNRGKGHIGILIGNVYHYSDKDALGKDFEALQQENSFFKEKITMLEGKIADMLRILALLEQRG